MSVVQRTAVIAAGIAVLTAAGCVFGQRGSIAQSPPARASGTWPMYQYGATHNAVFDEPVLHADWQTGLGDRINGGFALEGTTLYAVSFDHKLYAIDAASGKILWSLQTDDILMSTPVYAKGILIVGSGHNGFMKPDDPVSQTWGRPEGNNVFAYSLAGKPLWKFHTDGEDMPTPAIDGDTVVFGNGDAHAYALDLTTGKLKWQVPLAGAVTMASTAIDNDVAFISSCHNAPYYCETRALDARDGRTLWTNPNGGSDCAPAVADGLVFVNSNRNDEYHYHTGGTDIVAAIDERTGKTRWTYEGEPGPYTFPSTNERQIAGRRRPFPADRKREPPHRLRSANRKDSVEPAHVGQRQDESRRKKRSRVLRRYRRRSVRGRRTQRQRDSHELVLAALLLRAAAHRGRHDFQRDRIDRARDAARKCLRSELRLSAAA